MLWLLEHSPHFGLTLMASYAAFEMSPDQHPYGFTAAAFGVIYGIFGLVGGDELRCSVVTSVVHAIMDVLPLSLVNIEIFLKLSNPYAMVHALFVIPLMLDLLAIIFGDDADDMVMQTLKHVTNLANIASLSRLSLSEDNYMYSFVGLSILSAHTGAVLAKKYADYGKDFVYIMGHVMFYFATVLAVTIPNEAIKMEDD